MGQTIIVWIYMMFNHWINFIRCCIIARLTITIIIILKIYLISLDLQRLIIRNNRIMRIINLLCMKVIDNSWIIQRIIVIVIQIKNQMGFQHILRMEILGVIIIITTTSKTTTTTIIITRIRLHHMLNSNNWECLREEEL